MFGILNYIYYTIGNMKSITRIFFAVIITTTVFSAAVVSAGNISTTQKYSQFLNVDLDGNDPANSHTPTNDFINWNPSNTGGATVTDNDVTGYIWGEGVGWINLHPTNAWVSNSCSGVLGGYAWGQNTGWINFSPLNATGSDKPAIDPNTGAITGKVWSQNYGWIRLDSQDPTWPGLTTTWTHPGGGGGGGGTDGVCGSADGGRFYSAPTNGLCAAGSAGMLVSTGTGWIWTCGGLVCGTTASCSADKLIPPSSGPRLIIKKVVVGGTLAPGAFTLHVKENGVENHNISPFQGSSTGNIIDVTASAAHDFAVSEDTYPGYTASFSGDCNISGKVSFSIHDPVLEKQCIVTNTFTGNHSDYCLNLPTVTLTTATNQGYTLVPNAQLNGFDCLKNTGPVYCANHSGLTVSDAQNLGYNVDGNNNCTKKNYCANDTLLSIAEAQHLGYVIDAHNNCLKTTEQYCKNISTLLIATAVTTGYRIDINGNCNKPTYVCTNLGSGYTQVPDGYHLDSHNDCVPNTTDACPNVLGIQNPGSDCSNKIPWINHAIPVWLGILGLLSATPGFLARFANWMLTIFFMRKKQRGVVYDAKTKQPIDPAYVSVVDVVTGREVMNQITDMDGRYGFILPQGRYRMTAGKTNYQFPSKYLAGKTSDEVYDHLYFGEEFVVADKEQVVLMNIPMDSVATDWNQQEKQRMHPIKFMFENQAAWMWFFNILFAVGFVASIIITWFYPIVWNIVMTAMYVVVIALEAYGLGPVTVGRVIKNGQPVKNAIIRVINVALGREVAHKVTTDSGSYYILVPKADYYVTVEERQTDGTYVKTFTSGTVRATKGLINKAFTIM